MEELQDSISDNRLHAYLQRYIEKNKLYGEKLKGIRFCGHTVLSEFNAVFVVTNEKESRYSTLIRCHSAWACPYCSPRVMANKGTDIACAIDALATWYNQKACMITFTLPHDSYMSCQDSYEILRDTWRRFTYYGKTTNRTNTYELKSDVERLNKTYGDANGVKNRTDKRAVGKKGEVRTYKAKFKDPWADSRNELGLNHFVKVYEFTYGDNGWHPHIHLLAWVPRENLQRITEFEDKFLERWWVCAKRAASNYWNKKYPDRKEENAKRVETVYADYKMVTVDGHRSVYISKDEAGKIIAQKSSYYITGWSGNMELTGSCNAKHAMEGHYTPFQMLQMSCANAAKESIFMPLFIEYAMATRGHRRVEFSKSSGIRKIIDKWKLSEQYMTTIKKKFMDTNSARWRVVAWFDKQQWFDICDWDVTTDSDVRQTILELARSPDPWLAIAEYVAGLGIKLHDRRHPSQDRFEAHIYENQMLNEQVG